jgi:hypothetical protein
MARDKIPSAGNGDVAGEGGPAPAKREEVLPGMSVDGLLARLTAQQVEGRRTQVADDPEFASQYPNLWKWFTTTTIADQYEKDPPRLIVQVINGTISATLQDNALRCSLTMVGLSVKDALDRLERGIVSPDAAWNHFRRKGQGIRKLEAKKENRIDKK